MQAAEHWVGEHLTGGWPHRRSGRRARCAQGETSMWAVAVIIGRELEHDLLQVPFVEDQYMIQTFPAQRAGEPLGDGVGLRGAHGCADLPNAQAAGSTAEFGSIDAVAIADEITARVAVITGVDELLAGPHCRRAPRYAEVCDLSVAMANDEEHIQRLEAERAHTQEIARPEVLGVFLQEHLPSGRGPAAPRSSHILSHRPGRDEVTQLQ